MGPLWGGEQQKGDWKGTSDLIDLARKMGKKVHPNKGGDSG